MVRATVRVKPGLHKAIGNRSAAYPAGALLDKDSRRPVNLGETGVRQ